MFALKPIRKGDFIAYYSGRKLNNEQADKLWTKYLFEINSRWTIDGSNKRNIARYINHSCRPNAEADVKKHKVIVTAIRKIQPGDEISYDYGRDYFDTFIKRKGCRCIKCREKASAERAARRRRAERAAKRKRVERAAKRKSAASAARRKSARGRR